MPDLTTLIQHASDTIDTGLWDQSQACSLLAIAEMLKDTIDLNADLERREDRYDKQDQMLGNVIERLHKLRDEFNDLHHSHLQAAAIAPSLPRVAHEARAGAYQLAFEKLTAAMQEAGL